MSFKILADTFSVARDSNNFIQLKTLKSPRTEDEIWTAFKIEGDTKYARSTVQAILDTLDEAFFDNLEMSAYDRFEHALKEVNLSYKNLVEKRGTHGVGKISAIIAIFSGNELHLTQTAEAEAYLIRKTKLSLISEGLSGRSEDLFVNIASGELMPEDKILFSTSRLLRLATPGQITQMCGAGVVEAMDNIRELVLSDPELSAGVSCVSLKLSHKAPGGQKDDKENQLVLRLQKAGENIMNFIEGKMESKKINMSRSKILLALAGVVTVLILSIIFLVNTKRDSAQRDEYRKQIEEMNQELHTANTKGYANDKETANAILEKVEKDARTILETEYFRSEILALLEKVEKTRDSINDTTRLKDLKPYADLSSKRESVEALGLLNLKDKLFAFEYNALYEVILDQVMEPKTMDQKEIVIKGNAMEDQNVLTFLTKSGRIMEYNDDGDFSFISTDDETWKQGVDFATYGKYLYLLSPEKNQIYKYTRLRAKYSTSSEYNLNADLSGGISIAIDGVIYVLKEGGEIIKVFKGERQDFEIKDLGADLSDANAIYTLPEHKNLYVLDSKNKKVVIIEKESANGPIYKSQIYFEELEDVQGITVDKTENKMYLLTKKMIYQVEI